MRTFCHDHAHIVGLALQQSVMLTHRPNPEGGTRGFQAVGRGPYLPNPDVAHRFAEAMVEGGPS